MRKIQLNSRISLKNEIDSEFIAHRFSIRTSYLLRNFSDTIKFPGREGRGPRLTLISNLYTHLWPAIYHIRQFDRTVRPNKSPRSPVAHLIVLCVVANRNVYHYVRVAGAK